jgi:aldehyde:ferredoxin oxidoreductase
MSGYWKRILHVDLTNGTTWVEEPDDAFFRKHMGGRALIAHYLLSETPEGIDGFDPENRLIFAMGALTGTPVPGAGRHSVGAKSPLTGGFGESEAGGFWGAELKKAGWDGIVVKGKAAKPVYLWINDQTVELRDAGHLWGKLTDEVEERLREDHGDKWIRIAQCGIAGENLVRYACVVNDLNEVAGRTAGSAWFRWPTTPRTRRPPSGSPRPWTRFTTTSTTSGPARPWRARRWRAISSR